MFRSTNASMRVYPRACGGTGSHLALLIVVAGLSPRVRGNLRHAQPAHLVSGSIPARAGEPPVVTPGRAGNRVYPRACGGTGGSVSGASHSSGLSPRVRGNLTVCCGPQGRVRSIPARAGEPLGVAVVLDGEGVYPRACGGTGSYERWLGKYHGLSPRVRGNPSPPGVPSPPGGSIPARAGEPDIRCVTVDWHWVYPRACGGTDHNGLSDPNDTGLSPRVRGNRDVRNQVAAYIGSIPARAGEPCSRW